MIRRPESCSPCGSYECSVPMSLNGRVHSIDLCLAHIIAALNAGGVETRASCCGHGMQDGSIVLADGRELVVRKYREKKDKQEIDWATDIWPKK